MAFYVGQKVVCIKGCEPYEPAPRAIKGKIYHVSEVFNDSEDGELMLQFIELYFAGSIGWAPGFRAVNYRPVVERKTDISIFKAMLAPSDDPVDA